jgi:hypothetical protein
MPDSPRQWTLWVCSEGCHELQPVQVVEESRLRGVEAENEKLRKDARSALDALFDEAVAAHEKPHPLMGYADYLRYRLGTTGHAYELEGFAEILARVERLEADLQEAREALKPFAALAAEVDDLRHSDDSTCPHRLNAGNIRRARGVLRKGDTDAG